MSYGYGDGPFDTREYQKKQEVIVQDNIVAEPFKISDDIEAPAYYAKGIDKYPIFDVDQDDFNSSMSANRQYIQFKPETSAAKYMKTDVQHRTTFYIRTKDERGQQFIRRIG